MFLCSHARGNIKAGNRHTNAAVFERSFLFCVFESLRAVICLFFSFLSCLRGHFWALSGSNCWDSHRCIVTGIKWNTICNINGLIMQIRYQFSSLTTWWAFCHKARCSGFSFLLVHKYLSKSEVILLAADTCLPAWPKSLCSLIKSPSVYSHNSNLCHSSCWQMKTNLCCHALIPYKMVIARRSSVLFLSCFTRWKV